jgi:hypothetical protein
MAKELLTCPIILSISVIEAIRDDPLLQKTHMALPIEDLQIQMSKQLEE